MYDTMKNRENTLILRKNLIFNNNDDFYQNKEDYNVEHLEIYTCTFETGVTKNLTQKN